MNTDAHAWTEVYFPTFGWLRFEPTPSGQGTAHATNYMGTTGPVGIGGPIRSSPRPRRPSRIRAGRRASSEGRTLCLRTGGPVSGVAARSAGTPWAAVALAVIAAIVLACAIITRSPRPRRGPCPPPPPPTSPARRRKPVTVTSMTLAAAAAALVALALYRLISRTSGLNLGAGWATIGLAFGRPPRSR